MPGDRKTRVRSGGAALIAAALGFTCVFLYLAARFNYPDVLDTSAGQALPALLAMGVTGRVVWLIYSLLPLLLLPAAMGAFAALKPVDERRMRAAALLAVVAAVAMTLGLVRWPTLQWDLAHRFAAAGPDERVVLAGTFDRLNLVLGNYIGEFLGEFALNGFFVLSSLAMLRSSAFPKWIGWTGIASGLLGWVGMWRNVEIHWQKVTKKIPKPVLNFIFYRK